VPNLNPNSTNYTHTFEPNTNDLIHALDYNSNGQPTLRVGITNIAHGGNAAAYSAFGENIAVPVTPIIQLDGLYGIDDPYEFETFNFGTGFIESTGTLMKTHTGTGAYGYGVVRSNRVARYRPGQGMMARFTAMFEGVSEGVNPGVTLRAGLFAQEQAMQFGRDSATGKFGVMIANGGKAHIETLTVTAGGTGNVTITLNGVATVVAISSTNTTTVAATIAAATFTGWITEQLGNEVRFLSTSLGAKAGAFTATGTGTYTIATAQAGVAQTETWTYQEDWDVDKMDGTGPSGVTLDFTKLNVFQINFRWLGAGEIRWAVENPLTGDMIFVHHSHFSGRVTDVHTDNPCFKIGYVAANLTGSTVTDAHCSGASMMIALEGIAKDNTFSVGYPSNEKSSLGHTTTTAHHIVSFKNKRIYKDKINLRLMKLKSMSIAFQGNDPAVVYLFLNGTHTGTSEWTSVGTHSSVSRDIVSGDITIANHKPLGVFTLPINGNITWDLTNLDLSIPPGDFLSIGILSGQNIGSVRASLNWIEL